MPPDAIATNHETAERSIITTRHAPHANNDSLFERVAWLYAFFREHLFRDDTERIIATLWPDAAPLPGTSLIELGCGPGFYSRQLAARFPNISVSGVDRSMNQLLSARLRAEQLTLRNCCFERLNVLELPCDANYYDALIASRLFTILPEPVRAVSEIYRVLKPGGRCFIAEPRYAFWASIPLFLMWLLATGTHFGNGYREPRTAKVFSANAFAELFALQPWKCVRTWRAGRYQYALCEKA